MEQELIGAMRGDFEKYKIPMLKKGDRFKLTNSIKKSTMAGTKQFKQGIYTVTSVDKSFFPCDKNDLTYNFVLERKNSTYEYGYSFISIDKAIESGLIIKL